MREELLIAIDKIIDEWWQEAKGYNIPPDRFVTYQKLLEVRKLIEQL